MSSPFTTPETLIPAAIILTASVILAYGLALAIRHFSRSRATHLRPIAILLASTLKYLVLGVGIVTALSAVGINILPTLTGLGLAGFALGFALKDAISNLLAGAIIIVTAPFSVGDEIEILASRGRVADINLRYIVLRTEGQLHMIPNSLFLNNKLIRYQADAG